uniref:UDP-N-acetylglucosamine transferase subunit ALG14 n=1 Tax=Steinernema glaseri TaxID=37863 RepID=A0A1I8AF94_9BILA
MLWLFLVSVALGIPCGFVPYRAFLRRHQRNAKFGGKRIRLCAVMGSGGHTTEMLLVLDELKECCSDRFYVIAETDSMSERKVLEFEKDSSDGKYEILKIPRSREVGQSYFTSIFSTLRSILAAFRIVWTTRPDVVITNGPGTAIPICLVSFFFDLIRIMDIRIHFIESYCRVKSLSLTGLILYYMRITDTFIVQWKEVHNKYPRSQFPGRLR